MKKNLQHGETNWRIGYMVSISSVITFRNCIRTGYPFMEAILSMLPIVDEYLINDGGSDDGTKEYIKRLADIFPDRINLYNMKDYKSDKWNCVSEQYNVMISDAIGDWIFQGDADEVVHENDLESLEYILQNASQKTDVLQHPRREIKAWKTLSSGRPYYPCRTARNIPHLHQRWAGYGGDEFLDDKGWITEPRRKKTNVMIWHFYVIFPGNVMEKRKNDATFIAPGDKYRVEIYEKYKDRKIQPQYDRNIKDLIPNLPALTKGMVGWGKYKVREELFDIEWLKKTTGLNY